MSPLSPLSSELAGAYAYCEQLARSHYENFPVASHLLPAAMRPHVAAIYAFARLADDMADEGHRPDAERIEDLREWGARLDGALSGAPDAGSHGDVFIALRHSIAVCRLPVSLFHDLLSAFRQDVTVKRYETWEDLLDYCRRSANPVGRLVLRVAGREEDALDRASDAVCTALQLTNFWQDLRIDWSRERLYIPATVWRAAGAREEGLRGNRLPAEEMAGHGAAEDDLAEGRLTPAWRAAMASAVARTRAMFLAGRPLCGAVAGRLKHELRATWLGGMRVLSRIERADFDVVARRPSLGAGDVPWLTWKLVTWGDSL